MVDISARYGAVYDGEGAAGTASAEFLGMFAADLHAHPCVRTPSDFTHTLDVLVRNGIDMLGYTVHGNGDSRELSFDGMKDLARTSVYLESDFSDYGRAFVVRRSNRPRIFIDVHEDSVTSLRVKGGMEILSIMGDTDYRRHVKERMPVGEYLDVMREAKAITVMAHPYTIAGTHHLLGWLSFGLARFRAARPDERAYVLQEVLPLVDGADMVATNALWMPIVNRWLESDTRGANHRLIATSDAHGTSEKSRLEIGRARTYFRSLSWSADEELREGLRTDIRHGNFVNRMHYMPFVPFVRSVAFGR